MEVRLGVESLLWNAGPAPLGGLLIDSVEPEGSAGGGVGVEGTGIPELWGTALGQEEEREAPAFVWTGTRRHVLPSNAVIRPDL